MQSIVTGVRIFDGRDRLSAPRRVAADGSVLRLLPGGGEATHDFSSRPGATLLPGLVDTHLHLAISGADQEEKKDPPALVALRMVHNAQVNLRAGVTSVRDLGAKGAIDLAFRRGLELGLVDGPRYFVCGQPIIATGGHTPYMGVQVDGPVEARRATREQLRRGVDWIKMMVTGGIMTRGTDPRRQQLFRDEIEAVVETAHAAGVRVAAHCQGGPGLLDALRAGIDSLEHGIWLEDEAIELLLERDIAFVPTLSAIHLISTGEPVAGVEPPAWSVEKARIATEAHRVSFKKAVDAGVRIIAGTDYRHGSLPFELRLMHEWGMNATDVLRSATSLAAEFLGRPDLGVIADGKAADFIVVDGDPSEDIAALERVLLVVKDGKVVHEEGTANHASHVSSPEVNE